jgi:hypothetical protein
MDVGNFLMVPVEELAKTIVGRLEPGGRETLAAHGQLDEVRGSQAGVN